MATHDRDIDLLAGVSDPHQAADALGLLLYRRKQDRFFAFRRGFLDGLEAYQVSRWVEARGVGPYSTGWNLAAVFSERSNSYS